MEDLTSIEADEMRDDGDKLVIGMLDPQLRLSIGDVTVKAWEVSTNADRTKSAANPRNRILKEKYIVWQMNQFGFVFVIDDKNDMIYLQSGD